MKLFVQLLELYYCTAKFSNYCVRVTIRYHHSQQVFLAKLMES